MSAIKGRALHFVFKIADRKLTARFYRDVLGMKVLRHEEFADGCEATCNGPYANRWSKTMVGYGPEDTHFAIELTYNYPVKSYEKGNDFIGITVKGSEILKRANDQNWPIMPGNVLEAPGGYKFFIEDEPQPTASDPIQKVTLACSNLENSKKYWNKILGFQIFDETLDTVTVGFDKNGTKLQLKKTDEAINRAAAFGRIAFSCPREQQTAIDAKIKENNQTVLTPLVSLDTPGKATVRVIILADPDSHEICFVDDEAFRQLSQVDPEGEVLLDRYIKKDQP